MPFVRTVKVDMIEPSRYYFGQTQKDQLPFVDLPVTFVGISRATSDRMISMESQGAYAPVVSFHEPLLGWIVYCEQEAVGRTGR